MVLSGNSSSLVDPKQNSIAALQLVTYEIVCIWLHTLTKRLICKLSNGLTC